MDCTLWPLSDSCIFRFQSILTAAVNRSYRDELQHCPWPQSDSHCHGVRWSPLSQQNQPAAACISFNLAESSTRKQKIPVEDYHYTQVLPSTQPEQNSPAMQLTWTPDSSRCRSNYQSTSTAICIGLYWRTWSHLIFNRKTSLPGCTALLGYYCKQRHQKKSIGLLSEQGYFNEKEISRSKALHFITSLSGPSVSILRLASIHVKSCLAINKSITWTNCNNILQFFFFFTQNT